MIWFMMPASAVEIDVEVLPPWRVREQSEALIALQYGATSDGITVGLGEQPGVTLVIGGSPLEVDGKPLLGLPYPELPIARVEIRAEGIDLVVRIAGPPLRQVSKHPEAPDDPVLTWVRIRPRGSDWRVVLTGLAALAFDASAVLPVADGWVATGPTGDLSVQSESPHQTSWHLPGGWTWTNRRSIEHLAPYPQTRLTYTQGEGRRPAGTSGSAVDK